MTDSRGIVQRPTFKIGHGGTLDPNASGVLVIGVGTGTKVMSKYLEGPKTYRAQGKFGWETDSQDRTGIMTIRTNASSSSSSTNGSGSGSGEEFIYDPDEPLPTYTCTVPREVVSQSLRQFRGPISQVPPMFSALKKVRLYVCMYACMYVCTYVCVCACMYFSRNANFTFYLQRYFYFLLTFLCPIAQDGKRLYELAREGIHVHREPRALTIYELRLIEDIIPSADTRESANGIIDGSAERDTERGTSEEGSMNRNQDITLFNIVTTCSGGTYVRTLVEDIGRACGARAHLNILERTKGEFFRIIIYVSMWMCACVLSSPKTNRTQVRGFNLLYYSLFAS